MTASCKGIATYLIAIVMLVLATASASAVEPGEKMADPGLEARARRISQELRCLVCQNQSIDDSNAELARDLRLIVRERIANLAAGSYMRQVRDAGGRLCLYRAGMMHAKVVLVDDQWASVGTANLDNRSLFLNFEVNCLIYSPKVVAELERAFSRDLEDSVRLDAKTFAARPWNEKVAENLCRLFSPIL
jgi:hypothetical protein